MITWKNESPQLLGAAEIPTEVVDQMVAATHDRWPDSPTSGWPLTSAADAPRGHWAMPYETLYVSPLGEITPPPSTDPRWQAIRGYLGHHLPLDPASTPAEWHRHVYGGRALGGLSAWIDMHRSRYWYDRSPGTWMHELPCYRRQGCEAWSDGHPGGSHYDSGMWALEQYLHSGHTDMDAWQLFVDIAVHVAGQGSVPMELGGGGCYEKGTWVTPGSGTGHHDSHWWPGCVLALHYLTGELQEAAELVLTKVQRDRVQWQGAWGVRGRAWRLRLLRLIDLLAGPALRLDDDRASWLIDDTLAYYDARSGFRNRPDGASRTVYNTWQDGIFWGESLQWAAQKGDSQLWVRLARMAADVYDERVGEDGRMPYECYSDSTPTQWEGGGSNILTSAWLPALGALVIGGELERAKVQATYDAVVASLPESQGSRGMVWAHSDQPGGTVIEHPRWGSGAPKIAHLTTYGLRPYVVATLGAKT